MMDNVNVDLVLVDVLAINAKPTSGAIPMLSANVRILIEFTNPHSLTEFVYSLRVQHLWIVDSSVRQNNWTMQMYSRHGRLQVR